MHSTPNKMPSERLISLVVPAYNAGDVLKDSCYQISKYLQEKAIRYELVFVDDGSTDNTSSVLKELSCLDINVRFLTNETNMGKGYSVRRGVLESKGDIIFFTDADLSTPIREMQKLFDGVDQGYDIVIASRALPDSKVLMHQPFYREYSGKIFNLIMRSLLSLDLKDTQCGFKCFRKGVAASVFEKQTLNGFSFDVEVLYLARKKSFKIKEVPVDWVNFKSSTVNILKDGSCMFLDIVRIWINNRKGIYS